MAINYRNCPLKKRPVHLIDDTSDEPENLSTKPEDLSLTGRYASKSPESSPSASPQSSPASSPPLSLPTSTSSPSLSPSASTPTTSPSPPHYMYPMKHELVYPTPISPEYAPQTWHRSIAPVYAPYPAYLPYAAHYPHHEYMNMNGSTSTYSDRSISPPLHHHHHQPLAPLALRPTMYSSIDQASLSPNSSTSISPPPNAAQDLSEKRRQGVRHQCQDCGKSYSTFSGLSKHRQFHCAAGDAPRKSFSCKHCDKVYVSLGALKMHIRTHTLPCKCTICGKAFSRPWLLQGHIRTHTGEKPFSCQHCNRAFADRSNLRAHLQTHSDVKKYSCQCCSKTFSRMSLLTKHTEGGCNGSAFMQIKTEKVY